MATQSTDGGSLVDVSRRFAETYQGASHDKVAQHYFNMVDGICNSKEAYRRLLSYRDGYAQVVMDAVQKLLPSLNRAQKAKVLKAHLRLSKFANILPTVFYLSGIGDIRRMDTLESPSTDIYQGVYCGQMVFLKRYRSCSGSLNDSQRAERTNREALIWSHHQHPGVLQFIGVFRRNDSYDSGIYLVSPFLEHGTIIDYLRAHPGVNRPLLMRDIFDAMDYLHCNDIIHGDLKGVNILVDSFGRARVADLGFSRLPDGVAGILTWTSIQSVATVATVPWQAPELLAPLLGKEATSLLKPTSAADVYSLGCLAYEVFTDRMPFWDVRPNAPMRAPAIIKEVVKRGRRPTKPEANSNAYTVCGLTEEIWAAMELCWLPNPSDRISTSQLASYPCFVGIRDNRPGQEQ